MDISTFSKDHFNFESPYFKVVHTLPSQPSFTPRVAPSAHETKVLQECDATLDLERVLLEEYDDTEYDDDDEIRTLDADFSPQELTDNLYTASFSWATRLRMILENLYALQPFHTADVFRALTNCRLVPSKIAQGLFYDTDDAFDLHIMLGYFLLSVLFLNRSIESLDATLNHARLLKKHEQKILTDLHEQAQSLRDELGERIFLIHCKISQTGEI
ncbi:MAG TPA: hypothetical protein VJB93_03645 [Patescibacteria group bacterium]|nr:hypothetical protein [Patescibacteria group bacterium]